MTKFVYYKSVFKKTGKVAYITGGWFSNFEKFVEDNSKGAFRIELSNKEECAKFNNEQ